MNRKQKALVTGGCGFIGSHIVERLVAEGHEVTVLDDLSSGRLENIERAGASVRFIKGDIRDGFSVKEALAGCELLFHEAAFVSVPESVVRPEECYDVNIGGMKRLLEEAERQKTGTIVFASSCAVYGNGGELPLLEDSRFDPLSPYARSKTESERLLEDFCSRHAARGVALRYFNVYGPRQNPDSKYAAVVSKFIEDGRRRKKLVVEGTGGQTRDFVFVRDVAEANLLSAKFGSAGFSVMNVCSGTETSVAELAGLVSSELGGVCVEHAPARQNDIMRSWGSNERAARVVGFHPVTGIVEGLKISIRDHVERSSI